MKQKDIENYKLTGSIHTLEIQSEGMIDKIAEEIVEAVDISNKKVLDKIITKTIINPNKLYYDVYDYAEFQKVLTEIVNGLGINKYEITRSDFRLDSYEQNHYERYAKLNRYLISLIAVTYHVRNVYRTEDLFSTKQLSVAIKNRYFQLEHYDKARESFGKDKAKSRLEARSIKHGQDIQEEFITHWFKRWDKAIQNRDAVAKRYNSELTQIYIKSLNKYPVPFPNITSFISQYQNCIYTKKQLIDLLHRIGVPNPENKARNYKNRYGIEFFSKQDIEAAVKEIKRATLEFFAKKSLKK